MANRLVHDLTRSVIALAALAAILAGIPWALATFVGWPLPTALPSLDELSAALRGASISDAFLVKSLAVACWLAWAQVVVCFGVELAAWVNGRAPRHVAFAGALQPLVRHLVISATILVGVLRPTGFGTQLVTPAIAHAVYSQPVTTGLGVETPHVARPVVEPDPQLPSCTVQPRDSLWKLAEDHLGDGMRWRELWELNRDRPQPDGRALLEPDLIQPGWVLYFPDDAVGLPAPPSAPAPPPDVVSMAPTPVTPAPPPAEAPTPEVASVVRTPVTTPQPPTSVTTLPSTSTTTAQPADAANDTDAIGVEDDDDDRFPVPVALAGATLMAAGVISTVNRMRNRQARERHPGHTIPIPKGKAAHAERLLRSAAAVDPANRLDVALRVLAHQLAVHPDADLTRVDAVRVEGDRVEVLLTEPVEAEHGAFDVVEGRVWTLPAEAPLDELLPIASQQTAPAPAIVTVGHLDGCQVLIDLEAGGLAVSGDRALATGFFWSLALELATCGWADDLRVVVVGPVPPGMEVIDRVEVIDDLATVWDRLVKDDEAMSDALSDVGAPSRWFARLRNAGDAWAPTVILLPPGAEGEELAVLDLTDASGVVVARWEDAPVEDGTRRLWLTAGAHRLEPLGLDLAPGGLAEDLIVATSDLLATAASDEPGDVPADARPPRCGKTDELPLNVEDEPVVEPGSKDDLDRILVRILGPVEIEGGERPIDRRRVKELIVFLALHPHGVTESQIKDALWPDEEPTRSAFNQTVSRARTALGTASDGKPHVPYVADCLYRPGPHLVTDWQQIELAWTSARSGDAGTVSNDLGDLLDRVGGLPFAGTQGYEWAYELGLPHRISAVIEEARALARIESSRTEVFGL